MSRRQIIWLVIGFESVAIALAWALGDAQGAPALGQTRLTFSGAVWGILASVPVLAGLWLAMRSSWTPLVRLTRDLDLVVAPLFANCTVLDLAVISAFAGVGEEALFRGFMQTALAGTVNLWVAIAVVSVIFGALHAISFVYFIYAATLGAWFGVLLIAFDNLLVPIVAHAAFDFVGLVYLIHVRRADSADDAGEQSLLSRPGGAGVG